MRRPRPRDVYAASHGLGRFSFGARRPPLWRAVRELRSKEGLALAQEQAGIDEARRGCDRSREISVAGPDD